MAEFTRSQVQLSIILQSPLVFDGINPIINALAEGMIKEIGIQRRMFDRVTNTWSEKSKPIWDEVFRFSRTRDFNAWLTTTSKIFTWQALGTTGGRVSFSADYTPKTQRRVIGSGAGTGSVTSRGRSAPLIQGIRAGEWHLEIAERRQIPYTKNQQRQILKGTKRFFRGTKVTVISI